MLITISLIDSIDLSVRIRYNGVFSLLIIIIIIVDLIASNKLFAVFVVICVMVVSLNFLSVVFYWLLFAVYDRLVLGIVGN